MMEMLVRASGAWPVLILWILWITASRRVGRR